MILFQRLSLIKFHPWDKIVYDQCFSFIKVDNVIAPFIVINQIPADKLPEKLDYVAMLCENAVELYYVQDHITSLWYFSKDYL